MGQLYWFERLIAAQKKASITRCFHQFHDGIFQMPPELLWQAEKGCPEPRGGVQGPQKMAPVSLWNALRLPLFQHLHKFF
jgi:hypothetical protein